MSTRCRIAYFDGDAYRSVYCHHDGYVEGVGATLIEHYPTLEDAKALVSLGDFSSLMDSFEETSKTAYSNRGETCPPLISYSLIGLISQTYNCDGEFLYILRDGKWRVFDVYGFDEYCEETFLDYVEDKLKED